MVVVTISFSDSKEAADLNFLPEYLRSSPKYSQVYQKLEEYMGKPAFSDGEGNFFTDSPPTSYAFLIDGEKNPHRLVLVDVSLELLSELEKIVR